MKIFAQRSEIISLSFISVEIDNTIVDSRIFNRFEHNYRDLTNDGISHKMLTKVRNVSYQFSRSRSRSRSLVFAQWIVHGYDMVDRNFRCWNEMGWERTMAGVKCMGRAEPRSYPAPAFSSPSWTDIFVSFTRMRDTQRVFLPSAFRLIAVKDIPATFFPWRDVSADRSRPTRFETIYSQLCQIVHASRKLCEGWHLDSWFDDDLTFRIGSTQGKRIRDLEHRQSGRMVVSSFIIVIIADPTHRDRGRKISLHRETAAHKQCHGIASHISHLWISSSRRMCRRNERGSHQRCGRVYRMETNEMRELPDMLVFVGFFSRRLIDGQPARSDLFVRA